MTTQKLLAELMKGFLLIVGEYRGSHAELAGYVDRKTGAAIQHVRATHLAECAWCGHIDRVIITEYFADTVTTIEQAQATFKYVRGQPHVFYIESFKRERGHTYARLSSWGIEPIEDVEDGDGSAAGGPAPP